MTRIIALANQKGGVGKSTSTLALGATLADRGQRVLLVDLDPQASLTLAAGVTPPEATVWTAMERVIDAGAALPLEGIAHPLTEAGLTLLPSSLALAAADLALLNTERREYVLAEVLDPAVRVYDVILIDCPPALNMLVINALTAADEVLIPVTPDYLAVGGLSLFLQTVERVKTRKLNPRLRIAGLILTMTAAQTSHDRAYIPQLAALAAVRGFPVLGQVPRATVVRDSAAAGVPITTFATRHPAAAAYNEIAARLIASWGLPSSSTLAERGEVARG